MTLPPAFQPPRTGHPVRVILASQSPRRRELLTLIGIPHEVQPADVDERVLDGELPVPHCERLARLKAQVVAQAMDAAAPPGQGHVLVIGSDTIVVIDDCILGKPRDREDAIRMLQRLSGREHTVYTAVAVAHGGQTVSGVEAVKVQFRTLEPARIEAYVETGEPMDKAGAYGIQGYGATIVERISGDYFAVMGLPVGRMVTLIRSLGFHYEFGPVSA